MYAMHHHTFSAVIYYCLLWLLWMVININSTFIFTFKCTSKIFNSLFTFSLLQPSHLAINQNLKKKQKMKIQLSIKYKNQSK